MLYDDRALLLEHVSVLRLSLGLGPNDGMMSGRAARPARRLCRSAPLKVRPLTAEARRWLTDEDDESGRAASRRDWTWKSQWWRRRARESLATKRSQRHLVATSATATPSAASDERSSADGAEGGEGGAGEAAAPAEGQSSELHRWADREDSDTDGGAAGPSTPAPGDGAGGLLLLGGRATSAVGAALARLMGSSGPGGSGRRQQQPQQLAGVREETQPQQQLAGVT